jgi:S-adenosylmethionine synthetase
MITMHTQTIILPEGHFLFSSESVGEGHPDKLCDQVSDSILDACLTLDPYAKVGCESAAKGNNLIALGEITCNGIVDYKKVMQKIVSQIGYDDLRKGLDYKTMNISLILDEQSPEIAKSVHLNKSDEELGAGDQGLMFGYATNEWDNEILMPLSHYLSSRLAMKLAECRNDGTLGYLRPDCKTQVTIEYKADKGKVIPIRVHTILISTQHNDGVKLDTMRLEIVEKVIKPIVPAKYLDENTKFIINPSNEWLIGGPTADAGLTGRKIIVDTYGGWAPHGGGAFSGKDPTKVDRSAAYYCRWVAKNLVHFGLCDRVLVQVAYGIGLADPLSIFIDSYGTVKNGKTDEDLMKIVMKNFNFRPGHMIHELNLRRPIYAKTAKYGHFGRMDPDFTWEIPKKELII